MDIFKINLKTKFMRKVVSKIICKFVKEKFELDMDLLINEMDINKSGEDAYVKLDVILKVNEKEIFKFLKDI